MQNIRIGIATAMSPVAVKSSSPEPLPSWKMKTIAPNVAVRLRKLSTSALIGTSTLPNSMNSTTSVVTATRPIGPRQALEHDVLGVDLGGGLPADEHLVERRRRGGGRR